ncbi:hypothetical protein ES703_59232 [subsurface metagenome]
MVGEIVRVEEDLPPGGTVTVVWEKLQSTPGGICSTERVTLAPTPIDST